MTANILSWRIAKGHALRFLPIAIEAFFD